MLTLDYIYNVDVLEGLRSLPACSIDLVVTSPPYNRGYYCRHKTPTKWDFCKTKSRSIVYGDFDDSMLPEDYARWQSEILSECVRVIKPEGSIFYNHKDILFGHLTVHPTWVYNFPLKQTMIWDRSSTISMDKNYFFPITEWVFWIKKDFDSRCYFDRHSAMFKSNVWRFAPDKKNSHPAPFPLELPLNCVLSCSQPGGVVLDPFMGSGTTAMAAKMNGRHFIGFERFPEFCESAKNRLGIVEEIPLGILNAILP